MARAKLSPEPSSSHPIGLRGWYRATTNPTQPSTRASSVSAAWKIRALPAACRARTASGKLAAPAASLPFNLGVRVVP